MAKTYTFGDVPQIIENSLVDTYLKTVGGVGSTEAQALLTLVKGNDPYMVVNYHAAFDNVLESAVLDAISSVSIVGAITYGGTITLASNNYGHFQSLSGASAGGYDTLVPSIHNNTLWHFNTSPTTSTFDINLETDSGSTTYTVANNETYILRYVTSGSPADVWTFQKTNTVTNLSSTSLEVVEGPSETTVNIAFNAGSGISINDESGTVTAAANGEYTFSIDTATLTSPGDFITTTQNGDLITGLNTALDEIYGRFQTMTLMIGNMNSTFFDPINEVNYVTLMNTNTDTTNFTGGGDIHTYPVV